MIERVSMNNKDDVKKQLEIKNQEIYRNKLFLDLDHNLEGLVLSINNLLENTSRNALSKILEIKGSFFYEKEITDLVQDFIDEYRNNLFKSIDKKKDLLKNDITNMNSFKKNSPNLYLELIKNDIIDFSKKEIEKLNNNLSDLMETKFELKRLSDYLNTILITNLNNKVLEIVKSRDIILINTFEETYLKYLELNKNTIDAY